MTGYAFSVNIINCERQKMSAYGNAAVAQSGRASLGKAEVTGSIPVSSFIFLQKWKLAYIPCRYGNWCRLFLHFHGCTMLGDRVYCYRSKCFDLHKQKTVEKGYYMRKIILASASPRRRELLAAAVLFFRYAQLTERKRLLRINQKKSFESCRNRKQLQLHWILIWKRGRLWSEQTQLFLIIMKSSENRSMSPMHLRHLKCFREIYIRYIQG